MINNRRLFVFTESLIDQENSIQRYGAANCNEGGDLFTEDQNAEYHGYDWIDIRIDRGLLRGKMLQGVEVGDKRND